MTTTKNSKQTPQTRRYYAITSVRTEIIRSKYAPRDNNTRPKDTRLVPDAQGLYPITAKHWQIIAGPCANYEQAQAEGLAYMVNVWSTQQQQYTSASANLRIVTEGVLSTQYRIPKPYQVENALTPNQVENALTPIDLGVHRAARAERNEREALSHAKDVGSQED